MCRYVFLGGEAFSKFAQKAPGAMETSKHDESEVFQDFDSDGSDIGDDADWSFTDGESDSVLQLMGGVDSIKKTHSGGTDVNPLSDATTSLSDISRNEDHNTEKSGNPARISSSDEDLLAELFPETKPMTTEKPIPENEEPCRTKECEVEWALMALEEHEQRGQQSQSTTASTTGEDIDFVKLFDEMYGADTSITLSTSSTPAKPEDHRQIRFDTKQSDHKDLSPGDICITPRNAMKFNEKFSIEGFEMMELVLKKIMEQKGSPSPAPDAITDEPNSLLIDTVISPEPTKLKSKKGSPLEGWATFHPEKMPVRRCELSRSKSKQSSCPSYTKKPRVRIRQYIPAKLRVHCKAYNPEDKELTFRPSINKRSTRFMKGGSEQQKESFTARMQRDIYKRQSRKLQDKREREQHDREEAERVSAVNLIDKGSQRILLKNGMWTEPLEERIGRLAKHRTNVEVSASRSRKRRQRHEKRQREAKAVASRACESLYQRGIEQRKREQERVLEDLHDLEFQRNRPKISSRSLRVMKARIRQELLQLCADSQRTENAEDSDKDREAMDSRFVTFIQFSCALLYFGLVTDLNAPWEGSLSGGENSEITLLWHSWTVFTHSNTGTPGPKLAVKVLERVLFSVILGGRAGEYKVLQSRNVQILLRLYRANYYTRKHTQLKSEPSNDRKQEAGAQPNKKKTSFSGRQRVHYTLHGKPIRNNGAPETDVLTERNQMLQEKLDQMREAKMKLELDSCTFHPRINPGPSEAAAVRSAPQFSPPKPVDTSSATMSTFERLYNDAFQRQNNVLEKYLEAKQHREEFEMRESKVHPSYVNGLSIEERLENLHAALSDTTLPVDFHKKIDAMRNATEMKALDMQMKEQKLLPVHFKRGKDGRTIVQPFQFATEIRAALSADLKKQQTKLLHRPRDHVMKDLRPAAYEKKREISHVPLRRTREGFDPSEHIEAELCLDMSYHWSNNGGFRATTYFADSKCAGTPVLVDATLDTTCTSQTTTYACTLSTQTESYNTVASMTSCELDLSNFLDLRGISGTYLVTDAFNATYCLDGNYYGSTIALANGDCLPDGTRAVFGDDGNATYSRYQNSTCAELNHYVYPVSISVSNLTERACLDLPYRGSYYYREYIRLEASSTGSRKSGSSSSSSTASSNSHAENSNSSPSPTTTMPTTTERSALSTAAIVGIGAGSVVLIVAVLLVLRYCLSKRTKNEASIGGYQSMSKNTENDNTKSSDVGAANTTTRMWEDPVIELSRVPREKIVMGSLISSGAFGNVYRGAFNNEPVAIKMLLEATRQDVDQVNKFLAEVKLMASFKHQSIVKFVGVAWDSLNDLCVLSEYMAGGDLRALLNTYEANGHRIGFDRSKISIAYQISFALTYLHSLSPPIIHRDLKSRNVLLSEDHSEAKLADFGVSRERVDRTMTAGIGTLLWMAPEVMSGERYDDKADIFSLGVVLAELDTHAMPYSNAPSNGSSGSKGQIPTPTFVALIASGQMHVQFSPANTSPTSLAVVQLGLQCVALEPSDRPTAAEVLYRLQCCLKEL
ncbi:unnamed protein product [Phytophthora fragariaefolia]|uniref:Unnamed protein product n=1 Tax=Phytophthora fragariaefolia TaxID=1490495 RepID=A0A9W6XPI9_9STRA|nr:unnamed protein product [Phytophthora fragariaefolia]